MKPLPIKALPMKSLRAQVTALMVVAMVLVVAFANVASFFITAPSGPPPNMAEETAGQLAFLADLAAKAPDALPGIGRTGVGLSSEPPAGGVLDFPSQDLARALQRFGKTGAVRVVAPADGGPPLAALQLPDGRWLVTNDRLFGLPLPPGPGGHPSWTLNLATWLVLMVAGITVVVLLVMRRLMKPLSLIEEAAAQIGPNGEPPVLPEEGPAEVRAAAAAINRLSARLKGAMDSRMRIVAGAAHDLRTPLTRMRLRAEFIADDEERGQWLSDLAELDRIADSAIRLVREEVEAGPGAPVWLDRLVAEVVTETVESGRKALLLKAEPVLVLARPLSLKRALRNLIVNAATHGGGARVALWRDAGGQGEARAVLSIEDDGPGIPEALMGQVFEPFFRVDPARQAKIPGAGLGLAIANEIIGRHGGRLTLVNRPGGGLVQRVELPATAASAPEEALCEG
ncbi:MULTISPECIES: ATP-binding protein [unclassified Xanthobacter]|uniref:ATP-binding protein n=1 Tax=unclassified Xanthobacter TaxID=2623496 RepID=UPI001EE10107|nr:MULTISPECIES: ATP-binding protein [unclassified Xanthobacter]